jgi:hypothetical protein
VDKIARVRRAFYAQGRSTKKTSCELHVSRNTVSAVRAACLAKAAACLSFALLGSIGTPAEHPRNTAVTLCVAVLALVDDFCSVFKYLAAYRLQFYRVGIAMLAIDRRHSYLICHHAAQ